ncbi:lambda family phage tail tape measure protein [Rhodobacter aestuarii]|uniref:Phage tail tape measure protein, lambda family n=1 Tax=Rhodobacter aestuarii TaxID=453582 RepID=A0A1N7M8R5_9RHOB|nr:phage tail tape measure protein [Rhodobacter aestuarii]PTV94925.1 lambda family phage tail tape measure protein [Rhodobacter aestuarii]SIS82516.1 phage tail tape measure protein, lambda family [Rhodobacter aestuarii]
MAQLQDLTAKMRLDVSEFKKGVTASRGSLNDLNGSFRSSGSAALAMSNSTKAALANVGFQVQDIITQVSGGTSMTRALSMQLPQLLGGLGLVGVAAGVLAPLFIGIGAAFLGAAEDAKAAEEQMKRLSKALDELQSATKAAQQSRFDLMEQFGPEQVAQARQMLEIQRELARVNLARELNAAAEMIGKVQLGDLAGKSAEDWEAFGVQLRAARAEIEALAKAEMSGNMTEAMQDRALALDEFMARSQNYQADLNAVQKMFGATEEAAGQLIAAMLRLRDAEGPRDQAAAAAELRDRLSEVLGNMDGANEEALKLVEQLLNVEDAALRAAAADIAGAIAPAANEARRLADELGRAVTNAMNLAMQGVSSLRQAQIHYDFRDDPMGGAAALAREQFDATIKLPIDKETGLPIEAPPEVTAQIEAQRRAFVGAAVATEEYRQRLLAWRKEEAEAARAAKGGGSKGRANAYEAAIDSLIGGTDAARQQIAAIEEITGAGRDLGRALKIIAERQKILTAAQKAGIEVTPEMVAHINTLVAAYVDANDELKTMQSNAKRGEDAMSDFFGAILEGADAAKAALANLLMEIAKVQFSKGMMGLLGMTSWGGGLLGMIGSGLSPNAKGGVFAGGVKKFATGGVIDRATVFGLRSGLGVMGEAGPEAIMPLVRGSDGKLGVAAQGLGGSAGGAVQMHVTVGFDESGNLYVKQVAQREAASGIAAYDKGLPDRVQAISINPRKRS